MPWKYNVKLPTGPLGCTGQETMVAMVYDGIAAFMGSDLDELQARHEPLSYCVLSQHQCLNRPSHSCFIDCTRIELHQSVSNP